MATDADLARLGFDIVTFGGFRVPQPYAPPVPPAPPTAPAPIRPVVVHVWDALTDTWAERPAIAEAAGVTIVTVDRVCHRLWRAGRVERSRKRPYDRRGPWMWRRVGPPGREGPLGRAEGRAE